MTVAPELPGALEIIDALVARGVTVSCGHSDADAAAAHLAFDRGAVAVTHVFNAMRRFEPRDPGIAFAALGREGVFVTLIVDGHHLAGHGAGRLAGRRRAPRPDLRRGRGRRRAGRRLHPRRHRRVRSEGGVVRDADGSLAGTRSRCGRGAQRPRARDPVAAALAAASEAPARMIGRDDLGRIAPGVRADIVVLDDALDLDRSCGGAAWCPEAPRGYLPSRSQTAVGLDAAELGEQLAGRRRDVQRSW